MSENPFLQHKKLTILQQISDLKNWHKQQESKLKEKEHSVEIINNSVSSINPKLVEGNKIIATKSKNILNNSFQVNDFNNTPVKGMNTYNLQALLENNIQTFENQLQQNENQEKTKFRFLKKGEGIARFRMRPIKIKSTSKKSGLNLSGGIKRSDQMFQNKNEQLNKPECKIKLGNMPHLQTPDLKLDFKNWKSVLKDGNAAEVIENAIDNNQLEIFQPNCSINSSTASIMERLLILGRKHVKEREEMRVFEEVEQLVLDSSFCSTSSYVTQLMENAVMSTPEKKAPDIEDNSQVKQPFPNSEKVDFDNHRDKDECNKIDHSPVWLSICEKENTDTNTCVQLTSNDESKTTELEQSLHVRFNDEIDYKSFVDSTRTINSSKDDDNNDSKQFEDSEEMKEESCCEDSVSFSQCRSEEGLILVDNANLNNQPLSDTNDNKLQINTPNFKKLNVEDLTIEQNTKSVEEEEIHLFSPILQTKLMDLDREIQTFRLENNKLQRLREVLEKERKQFLLEKKKFLKEIEEEKKKNTTYLEEEKQKLTKEKSIFEKYSKNLAKAPTREERKEIQALRDQLNEIKEELNKKESRWGAAQARVRNQVKHLEEDNKKLREEIEVLRKQSKSLQILSKAKNKRPINNTKLIHAINDHISNIGTVSDDLLDNGYFKPICGGVKTMSIEHVDPKSIKTVKVIKENIQQTTSHTNNGIENEIRSPSAMNDTNKSEDDINVCPNTTSGNEVDTILNLCTSTEDNDRISGVKTNAPQFIKQPEIITEKRNDDGSVEKTFPDGRKEIRYKNGNVKKIDPISGSAKTIYFNGDVQELSTDGIVKYYFSESRIWHTTLPDGLEILDFPNGQVEKRHTSGVVEILYPNDCKNITYPNGEQEILYPNGTNIKIVSDKRKVLSLPNGQKEIHTEEFIRREYPDGTVKIVYPDGTAETVYSNGRVRLKDRHGNLVMDSGTPDK